MPDVLEAQNIAVDLPDVEKLEEVYKLYFTPPPGTDSQNPMFEQAFEEVTLFDYSLSSYTTDSVTPSKVIYA